MLSNLKILYRELQRLFSPYSDSSSYPVYHTGKDGKLRCLLCGCECKGGAAAPADRKSRDRTIKTE